MTDERSPRKAAPKIGEDVTRIETQLKDIMKLVRTQDARGQLEAHAFYRVYRLLAKAERYLDSCRDYLVKREESAGKQNFESAE